MTSISDVPDARKVCYWIPNKPGLFLPLLSTHNITESNNNITHAVIVIHGLSGNIVQAYNSVVDSFTPIFNSDKLLVIVPWFYSTPITSSDWGNCTGEVITPDMGARSIFWARNESSWIAGGVGDSLVTLSAYTLLDNIYTSLANKNDFPSLQHVTFAGFSAGGQMINRYAWASKVGRHEPSTSTTTAVSTTTTTTASTTDNISTQIDLPRVRFIVSDPSSFLYFSHHRPAPSCRARLDTGSTHTCDSFTLYTLIMPYDTPILETSLVVEEEDRLMAITNCREFDTWKYGTTLPADLHSESYLKQFHENPRLITEYTQAYRYKDVRYVLGAWDSCNCEGEGYSNPPHCILPIKTSIPSIPTKSNPSIPTGKEVYTEKQCKPSLYDNNTDKYASLRGNTIETATTCCDTFPDSTNNDLSITCGSELQGSNRLQRGLNYMSYLQHYFNKGIAGEGAYISEENEVFMPVYAVVPELRHDCPAFFAASVVQEWALQLDPLIVPPPSIPNPSSSGGNGSGSTEEHSDGQDSAEVSLLGGASTVHIAVLMVVLVLLLHFVYTASKVIMRVSREAQRQRHREASREGGVSETSYLL